MVEQIVEAIMTFLQEKVPEELIEFVISLCPVLECRGGMIAARLMEIPFVKAFLICYLGNMLPIPFIILFIRKIFEFLRKFKFFAKIVEKLEAKSAYLKFDFKYFIDKKSPVTAISAPMCYDCTFEGILEKKFDREKVFIVTSFEEGMALIRELKTDKEKIVLMENDLPDNY